MNKTVITAIGASLLLTISCSDSEIGGSFDPTLQNIERTLTYDISPTSGKIYEYSIENQELQLLSIREFDISSMADVFENSILSNPRSFNEQPDNIELEPNQKAKFTINGQKLNAEHSIQNQSCLIMRDEEPIDPNALFKAIPFKISNQGRTLTTFRSCHIIYDPSSSILIDSQGGGASCDEPFSIDNREEFILSKQKIKESIDRAKVMLYEVKYELQ